MSLRRVVPALLLLVVTLALAAPAVADVRVRIVRLSYLDGDVQMDRRDGQGFEKAMTNMPVVQGTRIWAREGGLAEIELEDGSTLRLTPHTLVEAQELAVRGGRTVSLFEMQEGTAYFNLHGDDDDNFILAVPGHQLRLEKGSHFRVTAERNEIRIAVFDGRIELSGAAVDRLVVKKGESISLDPAEDGRYFLSRDIRSEYYDTWDDEREDYRRSYARHNSYRGYSDVYYGAHDLHYWGNYNYVSGWGWVWRPHYVGAAWHPWQDGAWVWYPGFGYTWVSAYPWGWMPYHFGSWVWIPTSGWCWRPSGWRWRHNTIAHHAPRGFFGPRVPTHGSGGIIVVGKGGRTIYPRDDRGVLSTIRDAKDAAKGSRPLTGGSKTGDRGLTAGEAKSHDTLTTGSKSGDVAGTRFDGSARGAKVTDGDTARDASGWTPRKGRTVLDSRTDDDTATGSRGIDMRSGRTDSTRGGESGDARIPRGGRSAESGGSSAGGRGIDAGSSGRGGESHGGRSGGRSDISPPVRTSPPPAPAPPPQRQASPPPRSAPSREASPSRSTPSSAGMGWSGRSSGSGRNSSSANSGRSYSPGAGARTSSGRSSRSPR